MHEPYEHLAEIVRTGRTILPGQGTVEPENPVWVEFAREHGADDGPHGRLRWARVVLEGHTGPMRVLDIAAGHGLFGIEIAKQNPQAHVTGLDWAPVLRVALDNARKAGVHDRYDMLPGSAFEVDFGGPYDAVLLTNFLHHFDKPTCVGLLKKVRAALKPGGRAATLEFVPNEDRVSPPMPAAFAMTMLTTTAAGDAYTLSELTAMYTRGRLQGCQRASHPHEPAHHCHGPRLIPSDGGHCTSTLPDLSCQEGPGRLGHNRTDRRRFPSRAGWGASSESGSESVDRRHLGDAAHIHGGAGHRHRVGRAALHRRIAVGLELRSHVGADQLPGRQRGDSARQQLVLRGGSGASAFCSPAW